LADRSKTAAIRQANLAPAKVEQERTMKLKLTALAGVLAVLAASLASASANAAPCGPGYKKVGNYCITKAYNPNLKLKAR
jgi:hypothetical protein